jgi:hypothetical protein
VQQWAKGIDAGIVELRVATIVDNGPEGKHLPFPCTNPERRKEQQQSQWQEKKSTFHPQQQATMN